MKKVYLCFAIVATLVLMQPHANLHADDSYTLLAPVPLNGANGNPTTQLPTTDLWKTYIPGLIKLVIGVSGALAVVMIVIGGFQYVTSASGISKKDGKERITNALIGFGLVISSWLILYTINPNLVNFNLKLDAINYNPNINTGLAPTTPTSPGGTAPPPSSQPSAIPDTNGISPATGPTSVLWATDSTERSDLLTKKNVSINHDNCVHVGDTGCTSVVGLSSSVIFDVESLADACTGCNIRITGGTEYWLHDGNLNDMSTNTSPHKPTSGGGGMVLDMSLDSTLTTFLRTHGTKVTTPGCTGGDERYSYGGALYVNEQGVDSSTGPHYHICFRRFSQ